MDNGIRQPEEVIRHASAYTAARRRMPPMLHVALDELARSSVKKLFARCSSLCDCKRHDILELVAESIRATQLIESRPRPNTTRQRLVEQPAIHEHIHGRIGCRDLHGAKHVVPTVRNVGHESVQVRPTITAQ